MGSPQAARADESLPDPELERPAVREVDTPRQPLRVVVDSRLETPEGARVLSAGTLIAAAREDAARSAALRRRGVEPALLEDGREGGRGACLRHVGRRGGRGRCQAVLVERTSKAPKAAPFAAIADEHRQFYATQFHMEVVHTPDGHFIIPAAAHEYLNST